jgi:hypothetical protein
LFSAVIAAALRDPKLIADRLTRDDGRKARRRARAPPSTLAAGSGMAGSGDEAASGDAGSGKVACFTMT